MVNTETKLAGEDTYPKSTYHDAMAARQDADPMDTVDKKNIQGDIWPGLIKKYQEFYFFEITDAAKLKPTLVKMFDVITTGYEAERNRELIKVHKESSGVGIVDLAAVNISFSHRGMLKLGQDGFKDDPFIKGMKGDMLDEGRDLPEDWIPQLLGDRVDGVMLVCGTEKHVKKTRGTMVNGYLNEANGASHVVTLEGQERPGLQRGHEHFGFLDGVSQPSIIGLDNITKPPPGARSQPTRAGIILFGHDGEMENEKKLQHPEWAKDGSILVVRKIAQLVPEWNKFVADESKKLGYDQGQFGARLVGRCQTGAPVQSYPFESGPVDEKGNNFENDFDYPNDQDRCPFASHMRKTKPRSGVGNIDKFDIMRRGLPYGPELEQDEIDSNTTSKDRGLMFACYQSSLSNGFQFLMNDWVHSDTFPGDVDEHTGGNVPGQDPVIAQAIKDPMEEDDKILDMNMNNKEGTPTQVQFTSFVKSNGGEYFFTPSMKYLKSLA